MSERGQSDSIWKGPSGSHEITAGACTGVGKGESLNQGEFEFDPESGKIAGSLKIGLRSKPALAPVFGKALEKLR